MIETTDSNIHPLDSLIERTLSRDAESTRKRFAAIPNAQLTAKLALSTASRGLLGSLGAKLALYAGGALLIGSAAYFIPSMRQQPPASVTPATQTLHQPAPIATAPTKMEIATKSVTAHPSNISAARQHLTSPNAHSIKLDEGDGKNIPHITDPKYGAPLK